METSHKSSKGKMIASGLIPFVFLIILTAYVFGPGSELLDLGVPLPEISMELVDFVDSGVSSAVSREEMFFCISAKRLACNL